MNFDASDVIAVLALGVTVASVGWTIHRHGVERRAADVGAYFYRLPAPAIVRGKDGLDQEARYQLVIVNRGPAPAEQLSVSIVGVDRAGSRRDVRLADVGADEFPIEHLDVQVRYPLPWLLEGAEKEFYYLRRFVVELNWRDGRGLQRRNIALRRGERVPNPSETVSAMNGGSREPGAVAGSCGVTIVAWRQNSAAAAPCSSVRRLRTLVSGASRRGNRVGTEPSPNTPSQLASLNFDRLACDDGVIEPVVSQTRVAVDTGVGQRSVFVAAEGEDRLVHLLCVEDLKPN